MITAAIEKLLTCACLFCNESFYEFSLLILHISMHSLEVLRYEIMLTINNDGFSPPFQ